MIRFEHEDIGELSSPNIQAKIKLDNGKIVVTSQMFLGIEINAITDFAKKYDAKLSVHTNQIYPSSTSFVLLMRNHNYKK